MKKTAVDLLCWCVSLTGDDTEKIWVHRFLHFLSLIHLVFEIGKKKSKSSYLFISNKCEYLRAYLKSLDGDMQEALESCELRI